MTQRPVVVHLSPSTRIPGPGGRSRSEKNTYQILDLCSVQAASPAPLGGAVLEPGILFAPEVLVDVADVFFLQPSTRLQIIDGHALPVRFDATPGMASSICCCKWKEFMSLKKL